MILYKQLLIDSSSSTNNYLYNVDLLTSIRDQINQSEKNLGMIDFPESDAVIELSKAAFTYKNAVLEKGILYVDIETIHTPCGITFRRLLDSDVEIAYKASATGNYSNVISRMGIEEKKIDNETYKFLTVSAIVSEQNKKML